MTPERFIALWRDNPLSERAGAQAHFDDLCDLLGVDKPRDPDNYCFERGAGKASGGDGWADVWKRGCFGWENKRPGRDLRAALVKSNSFTRSYLAADPVLTGTLTGVLGADGITASYSSTGTGSQVPGVYPTVPTLVDPNGKLGNYTVTSTNGTLTITNTAPVCNIAPSQASIWPPNHKMVSITASGATDVDGGPLTYKVVSIFQDEPTNTNGDGNTAIDGAGVGTSTAQVRAERTGDPKNPGNGRVYHITFWVTDSLGLSCEATVKVGVPHDQSGKVQPIDGGPIYNSTVAGPPPASTTMGKGKG